MPQLPASIRRLFSFTAFQQSQGDNSFPGTQIDTELDQIDNTVTALLTAMGGLLRPDGKLANGIVTRNSLGADLILGVGAARPWSATSAYLADEAVTRGYLVYAAIQPSIGLDPALDGPQTTWQVVADLSQAIVIAAGGVVTASLADGAVTNGKLAGGITADKLAGNIPPDKLSGQNAIVPVGARVAFAGMNVPAGWLLEAGQAVSRQTYAALFACITKTILCDVAIGQKTLSNASGSIAGLGLRSCLIEGPGITPGTRLVSDQDGQLQMNANATGTAAQVMIRFLPYGQGDAATTFNVPDSRGRADFGRDDMLTSYWGTGAGRLVNVIDGSALQAGAFDAGAGKETIKIGVQNLPVNIPSKMTVSYPGFNYITSGARANVNSAAGQGSIVGDVWSGNGQANTGVPENRDFTSEGVNANPNGGVGMGVIPPAHVTNKIIFAGV